MAKMVPTGPAVELGSARASGPMIEGGCTGSVRSMVQRCAGYRTFPRIGRRVRPVCVAMHVAIRPAMGNPAVIGTHSMSMAAYTVARRAVRDSTIVCAESVIAWAIPGCAMRNPDVIGAHPMAAYAVGRRAMRNPTIVSAGSMTAWTICRWPMRTVLGYVVRVRHGIGMVATGVHWVRTATGTSTGLWRRLWRSRRLLIFGQACHGA